MNSSQCDGGAATAVGMLAVSGLVNSIQLKLCSEQQRVCWWGSNSSRNVGCQRTVNSMQLNCVMNSSECVVGAATAVGMLSVSGL